MTEPTIDEQKAWIYERKRECSYNGWSESVRMCDAIDASLERLKSLDALAVPVEPEYLIRLRNALKGFKSDGAFAGDKDIVDYIDSLQSALQLAKEERDRHMGAVKAYIEDAEAMKQRAERAEAALKLAQEELEKANNEFGSQTAAWPDLWKRIAEIKQYSGEQWRRAEKAESTVKECQKIAHDWGQGVTDAETAIRELHKLFPIDSARAE